MEFLPILAPILFFVVFIFIFAFVFFYQRKKERERTQFMQAIASQLAWNFAEVAPMNMIAGLDRFTLFTHGQSKQIKNFMYGEANGVKAAVFDYVYVTGSGKNRQTHYQTVTYLEPGNLRVPYFSLRPEGFFTKLLTALGYQDIDFGQRPEFSKHYLLRGQDEPAIRQAFNDSLLAFFETYQGTCVDAGNNQLLVFRAGYRCAPQEVQNQLALALNILNLLPRY
ncbi:MAG TPA: hypothetical protein VGQ72_11145 [Pyrinomonadaceae bacterium]|nr:hypothetical protein [Pyrinomonadaceae bacterium]